MEKTITAIIDSLKRYMYSIYIFFKGREGFYSKIYEQKDKYAEGEKYFIFIFSFILFYITSKAAMVSDHKITNNFLAEFYTQAISNAQSNQSFNYLFGRLLIFIMVAEIFVFVFQRDKNIRRYLSSLFYLSASWFMILVCVVLWILALYNPLIDYFNFSEETKENIEVIPGLVLFISFIVIYFRPYLGYALGSREGLISEGQKYKGLLVAFLAPALFISVSREVLYDNINDGIYFTDGPDKNELVIYARQLDEDQIQLSTSFIFENRQNGNYIFNPDASPFITTWRITEGEDDDGKEIVNTSKSDTINWTLYKDEMISMDKQSVKKLQLESTIRQSTYRNLMFLKDSTVGKTITLKINPINVEPVIVSKSTFSVMEK
jgi:hypothetical protein